MPVDKVIITREGFLRLIDKLNHLYHVVRPQVIEELQEARAFGVNVHNLQYINARERQLMLQRKIHELESKIEKSEVLVGSTFYCKRVFIGTVVEIENVETGERTTYCLVGPYESDVSNGKLASDSPVGRALLGKFEGEEVFVETPAGIRHYKICSINVPDTSCPNEC
ncbi:GreA/GreB family elongation factor [Thermodesulforhabdus norvegica]|uniref:Transcription elongation factor GreA n=1 Tax=Thermodesulforhabdus norvegica TaxID=39841 RepID=A0A1I4QTX4_9BACT|nr:transcription elongation factor GreA [Thermodesulforhabdus norvegica]SFM43481.1 transcription elongation factor GreA [Thermodesulforhabdus norvegica]